MPSQGSQIKFDRAKHHLETLNKRIQRFVEDHGYTFTPQPNPSHPNYVVVADGYAVPDPALGALIGDFAHNARSALDLVIASVSKLPADDQARFQLQFPIFDQETAPSGRPSYRNAEERYLRGVGTTERAVIEDFQPYKLGNDYANDLLGILANINDADKHRLIHVVTAITTFQLLIHGPAQIGGMGIGVGASIAIGGGLSTSGFTVNVLNGGVITKDHAPVATIYSEQKVNMQPQVFTHIQFGEGSARAEGRPLMTTLTAILDRVEEVLGKF